MKYAITILLACLGLGITSLSGAADSTWQMAERVLVVAQNNGPTLDQAVEQVRKQYNGRIVSAETKVSGNREVHYIKVLTDDGKVKTVKVPGRTLSNG
jgi:uncharacterized membrane protein YkoI